MGGASSPWDAWNHNAISGARVDPVGAPTGESEPPSDVTEQARQVSWRVDNMKLYGWRAETGDKWQYALFDISTDEGENQNLAGKQSDLFSSMYQDMWTWAATVRHSQESETMCLKKEVLDVLV